MPGSDPVTNLPLVETLPETTLVAVGDIMLSRNVAITIDKARDVNLPFEKLRDLLASADITFGNLECPLSDSNIPIRKGLIFRCLTKYVPGLEHAGFDVLSTANNHSFDQGEDNIDFTIDYLRSQNILPAGTTPSPGDGEGWGEVVDRNGIKFGFLAYSYSAFNDGKSSTHPQIATMNIEQLKSDILKLKSVADIIVVSMHAGTEYTREPNQEQIDFAHAAIDAGADIVLGHHPHWIQEIETYKRKPIFYSLGNFVFDQMWSQETREGLMVKLNFHGKTFTSAELMPVIIDNFCCPRIASEQEKEKILNKIQQKAILKF